MKIPFCRPFVGNKEAKKASETIKNGWLTSGITTQEAEKKLAEYLGAKHVVLLSSCTAALGLSIEYIKKKHNLKEFTALVPSLTFAATATEVIHASGEVLFGDVDENMCLKKIDGQYDIAIPVHLTGNKADTDYNCPVIEDSAHLIERNQLVGNKNLVCFSFYATKNLTMGEGGAIATNDDEAAEWFKQARHHGISKGGWDRYNKVNSWKYDIEFIGWKCNPSDVLSAILIENLNNKEIIDRERERCIALYNQELGYNNKGLHLYPIMVKDRTEFITLMADNDIQCSVHFLPLHKMTAFKGSATTNMDRTNYLGEHLVSLPLFPDLKNEEIKKICKIIRESNQLLPLSV
jgi:dTDP-4-amino-4,6-dideoxygalactose transaminase